jgi:tRNA modification GTPase
MEQRHVHDEQTIIALCTPQGSGALALIRLTGTGAVAIADAMAKLSSDKKLIDLPTHTIHYGAVVDQNNNSIDHVLFLLMHAPRTFTGQDTVEITCHNNPFIIESIIERAITCGARSAQPGEFSRRAVLEGKLDLVQAEAINELISAQTQASTKLALSQISGSLSNYITEIGHNLLHALMLCEASFEFLDEENLSFDDSIRNEISQSLRRISDLQKNFSQQDIIRQGVRVALIGTVNAGKSSLFNALLGRQRAIVTPIAGTTRDVIESGITRNGVVMTLVDTAGLRSTNDVIEQEGIRRSHEQAELADIVLLVQDGSQTLSQTEKTAYQDLYHHYAEKCLCVITKTDLDCAMPIPFDGTALAVSATTRTGITELEATIAARIAQRLESANTSFLVNKRQHALLSDTQQRLIALQEQLAQPIVAHELIAHNLKEALALLGECTGKTISEQGMDAIFKTFCVGK